MPFGMTKNGFKPKRLADILESLNERLNNVYDPETGEYPFVNETADGLLAQFTAIIAEELSIVWEQAYLASVQYDPLYSSGSALRSLVQINGITPSYGSYTEIPITVGGIAGITIPTGSRISAVDGSQTYQTVSAILIGNNGVGTGNAICTEAGPKEPAVGEIIQIQSPVAGWNSVTNGNAISVGTNADTDEQLHIKQQKATSATSYRQVDAIIAGIIGVPGVTYARLYVNNTTTTDARGIGPKTMAPVVVGGTDEDVANVLRLKAGSLDSFEGNLANPIEYIGPLGDVQTIDFYRPADVPIYINMSITVTDEMNYPFDAVDKIKAAIIEYAQYDQSGVAGFPPGEDVIVSRLYTPINSVPGFKVNSLTIGTSAGSLSTSDIEIDWNEIAYFSADNITVTVSTGV